MAKREALVKYHVADISEEFLCGGCGKRVEPGHVAFETVAQDDAFCSVGCAVTSGTVPPLPRIVKDD